MRPRISTNLDEGRIQISDWDMHHENLRKTLSFTVSRKEWEAFVNRFMDDDALERMRESRKKAKEQDRPEVVNRIEKNGKTYGAEAAYIARTVIQDVVNRVLSDPSFLKIEDERNA